MSRVPRRLTSLLLSGAVASGASAAGAADDIPLRSGALVELQRRGALAQVKALPGVVLVDCFADW